MLKRFILIIVLLNTFPLVAQTQEDKIFQLGKNYFIEEKYKTADKYFKKYLYLYPEGKDRVKCYDYLFQSAMKNNAYDKAIFYLKTILSKCSCFIDMPLYYNRLGDVYFQIGQYDQALQYYNYVLIKFSDSDETEYSKLKIEQITFLTSQEE
ncbi:MAG: tetratricopeptide repeat protein [Spirochaetes bacterium]|nr:tetratricopeptide repeat protein [Spirochaetota bacterium]